MRQLGIRLRTDFPITISTVLGLTTLFGLARTVQAFEFTNPMAPGAVGAEVRELQQTLQTGGYYTHPSVTGYYGPVTVEAVRAFQKAQGIEQVGVVGPKTLAALNGLGGGLQTTSPPTGVLSRALSFGMSGDDVLQLQHFLKDKGYLTATPNGNFGPATLAAVKLYQQALGLEQLGIVGPATRAAINAGLSSLATTSSSASASTTAPANPPYVFIPGVSKPRISLSGRSSSGGGGVSDLIAPIISGLSVSRATTSVDVMWSTDENASGEVAYGLTTSYGSSVTGPLGTSQSLTVGSLATGTAYAFRATATDGASNASDITGTFVTRGTGATALRAPNAYDDTTRGNVASQLWLNTFSDILYQASSLAQGLADWTSLGEPEEYPCDDITYDVCLGTVQLKSGYSGPFVDLVRMDSTAVTDYFRGGIAAGDITAARDAYWSFCDTTPGAACRWYFLDTAGNTAIKAKFWRVTATSTRTIGFESDGTPDVDDIRDFCAGYDCRVIKWYDQNSSAGTGKNATFVPGNNPYLGFPFPPGASSVNLATGTHQYIQYDIRSAPGIWINPVTQQVTVSFDRGQSGLSTDGDKKFLVIASTTGISVDKRNFSALVVTQPHMSNPATAGGGLGANNSILLDTDSPMPGAVGGSRGNYHNGIFLLAGTSFITNRTQYVALNKANLNGLNTSAGSTYPTGISVESNPTVVGVTGHASGVRFFQNESEYASSSPFTAGTGLGVSIGTGANITADNEGAGSQGYIGQISAVLIKGSAALSASEEDDAKRSLYRSFDIAPQASNDSYTWVGPSGIIGWGSIYNGIDVDTDGDDELVRWNTSSGLLGTSTTEWIEHPGIYGLSFTELMPGYMSRPARHTLAGYLNMNYTQGTSDYAAYIRPLYSSTARSNILVLGMVTTGIGSIASQWGEVLDFLEAATSTEQWTKIVFTNGDYSTSSPKNYSKLGDYFEDAENAGMLVVDRSLPSDYTSTHCPLDNTCRSYPEYFWPRTPYSGHGTAYLAKELTRYFGPFMDTRGILPQE